MTIKLNSHILEKLGLPPNCTDDELKSKLAEVTTGFLNIFHSEASKSEILNIAFNGCEDKVEILNPIYRIEKWCYHKVTNDTREIAEVVHIPHSSSDLPPTEAERIITRAWNLDKDIIAGFSAVQEQLINNRIVFLWKKGEYDSLPEDSRKALHALLHVGGSEAVSVCNEKWWEKWQGVAKFNLSNECCILLKNKNKTDIALVRAALGETVIRWRFLSFYRIIERGYLKAILQKINQEFMKSPQTTVSGAVKLLDNECSQFVGLVKDHDLSYFFEDFADCVENLSSSMNEYAIMLERELTEDKSRWNEAFKPGNKYVKGVFLCYKVRCSIVHAGASSLVFDEFSDADNALRSLVIPLENAVMKYMGIQSLEEI